MWNGALDGIGWVRLRGGVYGCERVLTPLPLQPVGPMEGTDLARICRLAVAGVQVLPARQLPPRYLHRLRILRAALQHSARALPSAEI